MSMVKMSIKDLDRTLSSEERQELEAAEQMHPVFDADSPEMTAEMLQQFKRMSREDRNKQTVSLRLSPRTLKIAKSYGKGYTSFLSRLLDEAIQNEELVRKCI
ncbi:MAG: BrnA antitoxin family protein [Aristaeellaceae bacterium]